MKHSSPSIVFSLFCYPPCPMLHLVCLLFCLFQCISLLSGTVLRPELPAKETVLSSSHSDACLSVPSVMLAESFLCYVMNWIDELILLKA